jgi:hypothetical protein
MTTAERMNKTNWRELKTVKKKRKYFYNVKTKESTWIMPEELKKISKNLVF